MATSYIFDPFVGTLVPSTGGSVANVFVYQGSWDPTTNTPTLSDGTSVEGYVYWTSAAAAGPIAGLNNSSMYNFQIGDLVIYNGAQWELTTPAAGVQSVNNDQGAVIVNAINQLTGDITAGPSSGSQSEASTVAAIQGTTVTGTTGTGSVAFSDSPVFTTEITTPEVVLTPASNTTPGIANNTLGGAVLLQTATTDGSETPQLFVSGQTDAWIDGQPCTYVDAWCPDNSLSNLVFAGGSDNTSANTETINFSLFSTQRFQIYTGKYQTAPDPSHTLEVVSTDPSANDVGIYGAVGQTGNLTEWWITGGGAPIAKVDASGNITGNNLSGTNTGDQTITLTGSVTGSGTGSFATSITANAITNADLAQMPANTIKANNFAGAHNASDLTVSQAQTMLQILPASTGDLPEGSFSAANNTANQPITGFSFLNSLVRSFEALVSVYTIASPSTVEEFEISGAQSIANGWQIAYNSMGDVSGCSFDINSTGHMLITTPNNSGFGSCTVRFRAITTSVP